jgi:hypothetical protein
MSAVLVHAGGDSRELRLEEASGRGAGRTSAQARGRCKRKASVLIAADVRLQDLGRNDETPLRDRVDVVTVLETVAEAARKRREAQEEWEESLREAVKTHSLRTIAPLAGVSYARVAQIVGRRDGSHV